MFLFAFVSTVILILWAIFSMKNVYRKREEQFRQILGGINHEIMSKGINFSVGPLGAWIELNIMNLDNNAEEFEENNFASELLKMEK